MENAKESPVFADSEQANRIRGLLMRQYNTVSESIGGGWFDPLLLELTQEDGSEFFDAEGWCEGFMLGVSMFLDVWRPVFEDHTKLLAPMVLLGTEKGWKILDDGPGCRTRKRLTQEAYEAIPAAVAGLREYFRPEREQAACANPGVSMVAQPLRRGAAKVGRNDPCPCGSGKKFKKCCGASEGLH